MTKHSCSIKDRAQNITKAQVTKANNLAEQPIEITYYRNEYSFMAYPLFAQQCFQGTFSKDKERAKKHWIEYSFKRKLEFVALNYLLIVATRNHNYSDPQ